MGQSQEDQMFESIKETSYRKGFRTGFQRAFKEYLDGRESGLSEEETLEMLSLLFSKKISPWENEGWVNPRYSDEGHPHP